MALQTIILYACHWKDIQYLIKFNFILHKLSPFSQASQVLPLPYPLLLSQGASESWTSLLPRAPHPLQNPRTCTSFEVKSSFLISPATTRSIRLSTSSLSEEARLREDFTEVWSTSSPIDRRVVERGHGGHRLIPLRRPAQIPPVVVVSVLEGEQCSSFPRLPSLPATWTPSLMLLDRGQPWFLLHQ